MPIFNGALFLFAELEPDVVVVSELELDDGVVAELEPEVFVVELDDEQALSATSAAAASETTIARRFGNLIGTSQWLVAVVLAVRFKNRHCANVTRQGT